MKRKEKNRKTTRHKRNRKKSFGLKADRRNVAFSTFVLNRGKETNERKKKIK